MLSGHAKWTWIRLCLGHAPWHGHPVYDRKIRVASLFMPLEPTSRTEGRTWQAYALLWLRHLPKISA